MPDDEIEFDDEAPGDRLNEIDRGNNTFASGILSRLFGTQFRN